MAKFISLSMVALFGFFIQSVFADSGPLFNVVATGTPANINLDLCLNAKGPVSCQNYTVSALSLTINTNVFNHTYPFAGIKINT